jgi:hypothetical protein
MGDAFAVAPDSAIAPATAKQHRADFSKGACILFMTSPISWIDRLVRRPAVSWWPCRGRLPAIHRPCDLMGFACADFAITEARWHRTVTV